MTRPLVCLFSVALAITADSARAEPPGKSVNPPVPVLQGLDADGSVEMQAARDELVRSLEQEGRAAGIKPKPTTSQPGQGKGKGKQP